MWFILLLLSATAVLSSPVPDSSGTQERCGYDSCTEADASVLNIHIVAHTHDDVGWLKTVDQYYYGSRNNIQKAGVQYILDSVVKELWEDPKRRFIYVETAFFWMWWTRQTETVRDKVRTLVREGRLQMVGGAWSMNDEAASHYQSTIDQFTYGLSKLNQTFGACGRPHVGWQIDPFGHSREFASLLAAMGYDGLFLGRIDYQDKRQRLLGKKMEMVWRGDDSLGKSSDIFTGVLYNTYSPPPGFCFDVLCNDEPIIDDPSSPMYNVDQKVSKFVDKVREMSHAYKTKNILVTMGDDFNYQDAGMWFNNLDRLIKHTNLKSAKEGLGIKAFYSTPDCYLKAVRNAFPSLPTKQDDFFPYASDPTAYWTGYFTSRPTTKYFERESNAFLQMVKNLQVMLNLPKHNQFVIDELKSAMGVMQHHDAITGTEKQHVAHDYERILNNALEDVMIVPNQAYNKVLKAKGYEGPELEYKRCRLNESSCSISERKKAFTVTIFNPLAWSVTEPIRIPVVDGSYTIKGPNAKEIQYQILDIPESVKNIPTRQSLATHELIFIVKLKPLSFQSYHVTKNEKTKRNIKTQKERKNDFYTNLNDYWTNLKTPIDIKNLEDKENRRIQDTICNENLEIKDRNLDFDVLKSSNDGVSEDILKLEQIIRDAKRNTEKEQKNLAKKLNYPSLNEEEMRMLSDEPTVVNMFEDKYIENQAMKLRLDNNLDIITLLENKKSLNFAIKLYYWSACFGDNTNTTERSSGAYIFRPNITKPIELSILHSEIKHGPLVSELRTIYEGNVTSNTRLYTDIDFIEVDFTVGPIPIDDNIGKEYIIKYITDINNNGIFYTDSNGRQMLKRKLNERPQFNLTLAEPIAGNYYPVTNKIYIEDSDNRLSVLTDRSQGGSSLNNGEIEIMLHRRLLHDDAFGVGEALNEVLNNKGLAVRGTQRILTKKSDLLERKRVLEFHCKPIILFADAENLNLSNDHRFVGLYSVPDGVHLLSIEPWGDTSLLLRIENYLEKSINSTIEVNLSDLFNFIKINTFKETTLAANQWMDEYEKLNWTTDNESFNESNEFNNDDGFKVKIKAKQIRTFIIEYEYV
ncbi:PREDICTED: lysosomal alpha-mannosidase-like isoform X2 [Papilio xuthus]|uniref:Alpha-mannosidase n=1 Tax=Papilio xuthus TaxID=66420 RepID=A0AAJ6ZTG7_PAPXU|nr:PREDICTED: lysosomal alpha-mannosidase-like isoform X2 [Papilio xuthus]